MSSFVVCVAPNGVQGRVFAPNGVYAKRILMSPVLLNSYNNSFQLFGRLQESIDLRRFDSSAESSIRNPALIVILHIKLIRINCFY